MRNFYTILVTCLLSCLAFSVPAHNVSPTKLALKVAALRAQDVAVIVNDADPLSVQIATYYQHVRKIPDKQIIHIRFQLHADMMPPTQFEPLKQQVDTQTPKHVQALVLTWIQPFRVGCMSITSAFAFGFDPSFCAEGCLPTRHSDYAASESSKPFTDYHIRPTMVLGGYTFSQVKQLIDRGIAADYTHPKGIGYLLKTSDTERSSRALGFPQTAAHFKGLWPVYYLERDSLSYQDKVLFYFTGLTQVPDIASNTYLPGAVADHLTSAGGVLTGSEQMNVLDWLQAGVTGTYGAVVEPCNFPAKFPNPEVLIHFYLRGSSLLEAYWKSVEQPGQGIFVGEPLAKPFAEPPAQ